MSSSNAWSVPDQTGRSNYVDNDRIGVALGGSYELELLAAIPRDPVSADSE